MLLGSLDIAVLVVYIAGLIAVGVAFAGKQKTTNDYFLAGRTMPWLAVAMSMYASVTSAVTYMGLPGMAYSENISLIVVCFVSPLLVPVLIKLFYPLYRKYNVTTSYEYIGHRFGRSARSVSAGLFVCARLGWMATVIFAPSLALSIATGMPIWVAIVVMGVVATLYTVMGGMAAVIWTDVPQFIIMIGGAVLVAVMLGVDVPGGVSEIFAYAGQNGHLKVVDWHLSLFEMSGAIVALTFFFQMMQDYGTDQVSVQRLMSVKTFKGTIRAIVFNAGTDVVVISLLLFIGLGLFAYYHHFPQLLAQGLSSDSVFPYYITHRLPQGISGLLLAAIFAAAMSSMDSGINSLSTVIVTDFIRPLAGEQLKDSKALTIARYLTLVLGVCATSLAFVAASIGHIIKAYTTFISLFSAPVLALFLLGILTRKGHFKGWLGGCLVSIPVTLYAQFGVKVHWVYYFPISFFVAFVVGYVLSYLIPVSSDKSDRLKKGAV